MTSGLRVPAAVTFGEPEALDILSIRAGEVVPVVVTTAGAVHTAVLPDGTQAIEISIESAAGARVLYVASADAPDDATAFATANGVPRVIPAGGQMIEFRRALAGDTVIVLDATGSSVVTLHAHVEV